MRLLAPVLLAAAIALSASAQSMVEYSIGMSGAMGASQAMKGLGKSTERIFGSANRQLGAAERAAQPRTVPAAKTPAPAPVKLSPVPDVAAVKIGTTAEAAREKFGKPWMTISDDDGEQWIYGAGSASVTITIRGGKIASVSGAEKDDQAVLVIE